MTTKKCNPLKNKWCEYTKEIADFENPDAVGLAVSQVINLKNNKKGYGLRYGIPMKRRKELGGKFTWIDYCPFCGADVSKRTK